MTKLSIIGFGLILLFGCKAKFDDFLFDESKMSRLIKYEYDYKQNKKISKIKKDYTIMYGRTVDSMVTKTLFEYNEKGQIVKEITTINFENTPDFKLYEYNSNDSLISKIYINADGDTTHTIKYGYFPDGMKIIFQSDIWIKLDETKDFNTAYENRTYDTILFIIEYLYENNKCKQLKEYDKNNKLTNDIYYEYRNDKISKEEHYSYFNDLKVFVKRKFYDYSKSQLFPDSYSLSKNNDTIDFSNNVYNAKERVSSVDSYENGKVIEKVFYKNNKEVGEIYVNKELNHKRVTSTTYYDNGDIKEERSY